MGMKRKLKLIGTDFVCPALIAAVVLWLMSSVCDAQLQSYQVRATDGVSESFGSAITIGTIDNNGQWVFVTTAHTLRGMRRLQVSNTRNGWADVTRIRVSEADDVASFEVSTNVADYESAKMLSRTDQLLSGLPVQLCGHAESMREVQNPEVCWEAIYETSRQDRKNRLVFTSAYGALQGDSGGPATVRNEDHVCVVGLIQAFNRPTRSTFETIALPLRLTDIAPPPVCDLIRSFRNKKL